MKARNKFQAFLSLIFLSFFLLLPQPVEAKKRIGVAAAPVKANWKIVISPKIRSDRKALIITYSNLQNVASFTYQLTYEAEGVDQGVYSTVTPLGENSTVRELLFGTCSGSVCRYHPGIQNMKFVVNTVYKNGQRAVKRYRVKP